jgi:hypothetical protein
MTRRASRRLTLPYRALTLTISVARAQIVNTARTVSRLGPPRSDPPELSRSTALEASWALNGGAAMSHLSPPMVFLHLQRTGPKATLLTGRVCFAPTTLLSFRLQGFELPEEESASPHSFLSCRLAPHSGGAYDSRGFDPSENPDTQALPPKHPHALLAFFPLRLSLPPP